MNVAGIKNIYIFAKSIKIKKWKKTTFFNKYIKKFKRYKTFLYLCTTIENNKLKTNNK